MVIIDRVTCLVEFIHPPIAPSVLFAAVVSGKSGEDLTVVQTAWVVLIEFLGEQRGGQTGAW